MANGVERRLAELLADGDLRIGQIIVLRANSGWELRHRDDPVATDLRAYDSAGHAAEIARFDDAGKYRALKSAPNLQRGWRIVVRDLESVRIALDHFYPARIDAILAADKGALRTTPLRETLNRQSGIYRIAARISDEQLNDLVAGFCRSDGGCLRTILWRRDPAGAPPSTKLPREKFDAAHDQTGRGEPCAPLLCQEACNLLVAAARKVVKRET
jgi:sirohydrochlorin cobaltochelatase